MSIVGPEILVIARHGQSELNALMQEKPFCPTPEAAEKVRRIADHKACLTPEGIAQARLLGEELIQKFVDFDLVIHSGYRRAEQTAECITGRNTNQKFLIDSRLRERDSGYSHGMTKEQHDIAFPWMQEYWDREKWFLARPPGGESLADLHGGRVRHALQDILKYEHAKCVLIVCHGRVLQVATLLLNNLPVFGDHSPVPAPPYCAYNAWRREQGPPQMVNSYF